MAEPAGAITLYFNESPARDSTVAIFNPVISVTINDPAGLYSSVTIKVDNKKLTTKYSYATGVASAQASGLANGVHRADVSALNYLGLRSSHTWSFAVAVPPTVSTPQPVAGSVASVLRPDVTATAVAAPGSSVARVEMRIDGMVVPAAYDAGTKTVAWAQDRDLGDDSVHSVRVTAVDTTGASASLDWSFTICRFPEMPASSCLTCHPGEPLAHDTTSPETCFTCHNEPDYSGTGEQTSPIGDCVECHCWVHPADRLVPYECEFCHSSQWTGRIANHDLPLGVYHRTTTDMSGCACHSASLTKEHFRRTEDEGASLTCETCHSASAPAAVLAAIENADVSCGACHSGGTHSASHTLARTDSCASCHAGDDLLAVHFSESSLTCETCHASTDPEVVAAIAADNLNCSACHVEQGVDYHAAFETMHVSPTDTCQGSGCHDETRLVEAHADVVGPDGRYPQYADTCSLCHCNEDPMRVPESATAECATCHADRLAFHGYTVSVHTATLGSGWITVFDGAHHDHSAQGATSAYQSCMSCHNPELGPVHADACSACHPAPRDTFVTWDGGCSQAGCHTTYHAASAQVHWSINDQCSTCHASGFSASSVVCTPCHQPPNPGDTTPPVTTCDAVAAYEGAAVITFTLTDSGQVGIGTTFRRLNGGAVSTGDVLQVSQPGQYTLEYWSVDQYGNTEAANTTTFAVTADSTPPVTTSDAKTDYEGGATITLTAVDGSTLGVKNTYYALNGGATQTGTTVTIAQPASGSVSYTLTFWSVDWSDNVETPNTVSFTVTRDVTPPVSTLGAQPYYNTSSVHIPYSAVDTGVGVYRKYYRIDGGSQQHLSADVAGFSRTYTQGTHTIQYWSVDNNGNAEAARMLSFVVDWTAPTVSSDAAATYPESGATITITASDSPAGGAGPPNVVYCLNGGDPVTGPAVTTVEVNEQGLHTIEYWAVDLAGNASAHSTVSFAVGEASVGTIRLVWRDNDITGALVNVGSSASWTIRLGGPSGQVVSTGYREGGSGWTGVDDVEVSVTSTVYYVSVEWWDDDIWYGGTTILDAHVTYAGQVVRLSYN